MKQSNSLDNVTNIVIALVMIVTLGAIGIYIADTTLTTTALTTTSLNATGNLTITGNPNCGELVNITNAAGTLVTFYLNTTLGCTQTSVYNNVNITVNSSTGTAINLTSAVNLNSTLNATITAANPTAGVMTLTYFITGVSGNSVATAETMINGSWINGATLTGGINASSVGSMQENIMDAGDVGASFIVILIIAFIGGIAIMYLTSMFKRGR